MPKNRTYWWIFSILLLCGCMPIASEEPTAIAVQPATITTTSVQPTATTLPTVTSSPPTPIPPTAPLSPTPLPPTATPIPTPDPVAGLTIPDLRTRNYGDGEIRIGEVYNQSAGYTSYRITYPADGLQLTGLVHVPDGAGPFPIIIANRGYIAPERYLPGMDSRAFSDFMARSGYLVVPQITVATVAATMDPIPFIPATTQMCST